MEYAAIESAETTRFYPRQSFFARVYAQSFSLHPVYFALQVCEESSRVRSVHLRVVELE